MGRATKRKSPRVQHSRKTHKQSKWDDEHIFTACLLASQGSTNRHIALTIGIGEAAMRKWIKNRPIFARAIERGKEWRKDQHSSFRDIAISKLPDELKEVYFDIERSANDENALNRVQKCLADKGKAAKQLLFLTAWYANNFNVSEACRFVSITHSQVYNWCNDNSDFGRLFNELDLIRKDFYESALVSAVKNGDSAAIIFANKTKNRDRGYNEKIEIEHSGHVNTNQNLLSVTDILDSVSVSARREILKVIREHDKQQKLLTQEDKQQAIEVQLND